jgi:hypothetical protein
VSFEESRAPLGIATQRPWSDLASARETPCLFGLDSLVTGLGQVLHRGLPIAIRTASWDPKTHATFSDVLAAVWRHCWDGLDIRISGRDPAGVEIPRTQRNRLINVACYSH